MIIIISFCIRVTVANFLMSGIPEFKDLLNSIARGLLIWYFASFKIHGARQSGPGV